MQRRTSITYYMLKHTLPDLALPCYLDYTTLYVLYYAVLHHIML